VLSFFVGLAAFLSGLLVGLTFWMRFKSRAGRQASELQQRIIALQKEREATDEKLRWVEDAQRNMREAFTALASDALRTNSETWTTQAKKDLSVVVDPLKESLTSLDGKMRELEKAREGAYKSLEQQLLQLRDTHSKLQETTITLTQALRSPTVRGRWGEIQLRRVVEMAGMVKHVAFDEQAATEQGRPDMIAHMPNGGVLPVDSKVPLDSYLLAMESTDEETRRQHLAQHAKAMRSRIKELGQKQYWDQFEASVDFVVMFVPNEACLGAAFEADPALLEYAIEKKVLISSPVTLLALLRTVAYGWQQHQITENALKIAQEGKDLYGRLQLFVERFAEVGKYLGQSVAKYNRAVGSLDRRLMPAARRFLEHGLATEELQAPAEIDMAPALPANSDSRDGASGES
jgi:DNA recombination protein RmuC